MTTKTMSAVGTMQKFVSLDGKKPRKPSRDRHPARPDLQHLRSRRLLLTRFFQFARESGDLHLEIVSRSIGRLCVLWAQPFAYPLPVARFHRIAASRPR